MRPLIFLAIVFSWLNQSVALDLDIQRVSNNTGSSIEFRERHIYDFNDDGVTDIVKCNRDHFIQIVNGANKSKNIYSWVGPAKTRTLSNGARHYRNLSGCEIIKMPGQKRPMVILTNFWDTSSWRANAYQYIVFHNGTRYIKRVLKVEGFGNYLGVTRSAQCGKYPGRLVKRGYSKGLLCFFADYASDYHNRSVLLKLEYNSTSNTIVAKDLTASSGLMWSGGARGTSIWGMPVGAGFYSNQRDGAFMMDAAFFDFNGDGPEDFVTVGQHASVRAHQLIVDTSKAEGVRYHTTALTSAHSGNDMTEFLKIRSLDRNEPDLDLPCAYVSGEREGRNDRDHLLCYDGGWETHLMPIDFNSEYHNSKVRLGGSGNILIKTQKVTNDGPRELTFRINQ